MESYQETKVLERFGNTLHCHWLNQGVLSRVRNQGICSCCWAMSVTGAIESRYSILYAYENRRDPVRVQLSPQHLLDCMELKLGVLGHPVTEAKRKNGCYAAYTCDAFKFTDLFGNHEEQNYGFEGGKGPCNCTDITGFKYYTEGVVNLSRSDILGGICTNPISCVLPFSDEKAEELAFLKDGIYHGDSSEKLFELSQKSVLEGESCVNAHAMIVVGYGTEEEEDYWLLKNSWGTRWGVEGYGRFSRDTVLVDLMYPFLVDKDFQLTHF